MIASLAVTLLLLLSWVCATSPQPPPCDVNPSGPQPWFYPPQQPQQRLNYGAPGFGDFSGNGGGNGGGKGWQPPPLQYNGHLQQHFAGMHNNSFGPPGAYDTHLHVQHYGQQQQYEPQQIAAGQLPHQHQRQPLQQQFSHQMVPPPPPPLAPIRPSQQPRQFVPPPPPPPAPPAQPRMQHHSGFHPAQNPISVFVGDNSQGRRGINGPSFQQVTPSRSYRTPVAFSGPQRSQVTPTTVQETPSRRNERSIDDRR